MDSNEDIGNVFSLEYSPDNHYHVLVDQNTDTHFVQSHCSEGITLYPVISNYLADNSTNVSYSNDILLNSPGYRADIHHMNIPNEVMDDDNYYSCLNITSSTYVRNNKGVSHSSRKGRNNILSVPLSPNSSKERQTNLLHLFKMKVLNPPTHSVTNSHSSNKLSPLLTPVSNHIDLSEEPVMESDKVDKGETPKSNNLESTHMLEEKTQVVVEPLNEVNIVSSVKPLVKRGRGRPKGSTNKKKGLVNGQYMRSPTLSSISDSESFVMNPICGEAHNMEDNNSNLHSIKTGMTDSIKHYLDAADVQLKQQLLLKENSLLERIHQQQKYIKLLEKQNEQLKEMNGI